MRLSDATVLVTGATGGIGAATARRIHALGARLVVHGRDPDRLAQLATSLDADMVIVNLIDDGAAEEVARKAGPVDVLVHCAGVGLRCALSDLADGAVDRVLATNLRAPILLARELVPAMCAAGRGHLVFVGSIAGLTGVGNEAVYAATKAGLLTFAQSLRLEVAAQGVTVSTIHPAVVDTGFWEARGVPYHRKSPRPISPEMVAELLVRDVQTGNCDRVVPCWLSIASAVRSITPRLYTRLAGRFDKP